MRSFTVVLSLAAAAVANPLPQSINPAANGATAPPAKSVPWGAGSEIVPYNSKSVSDATYNDFFSSLQSGSSKRSLESRTQVKPCGAEPAGYGPVPTPDTPTAFSNYSAFSSAAISAATPNGYVNAFTNLNGATSQSGYIGYDTLQSYDVQGCAIKCNSLSGCVAFNIYFERDPTILPADSCPNPASTTNIKCSYWGLPVGPATATNMGQTANDFQIVNAGSNGYNAQNANNVPGYSGDFLDSAAIRSPDECNSYITYKVFNDGQPFDPSRCAAACKAETDYNAQYQNSKAVCRFFNTYILSKNGIPQGQYCTLYTASWDDSHARNTGYTSGSDNFTISYSYSYSNTTDPRPNDCTCGIGSTCNTGNITTTTTTTTAFTTTTITPTTTTTSAIINTTTTTPITTTTTTSTAMTTINTTKPTSTTTTTTASVTISVTTATTTSSKITSTTTSCTPKSTTAATTTTTSPTTLSTTTKTTVSASATVTPKGPCFKAKIQGPWYCDNKYIGLDDSGTLSYWTQKAAVMWLDDNSIVRHRDGRFGKCPNAKTSDRNGAIQFGQSADQAAVQCTGSGYSVSCKVAGQSITSIWAHPLQGAIVLGNRPNGWLWEQVGVQVEFVQCTA